MTYVLIICQIRNLRLNHTYWFWGARHTFTILRKKVHLMWSMHIIASMLDCSWKHPLYLKCFGSNSKPTVVYQKQTYIPHSSSCYRRLIIKNKCRIFLILPVLSQLTAMAFNKSCYEVHVNAGKHIHKWVVTYLSNSNNNNENNYIPVLQKKKKKKKSSTVTSIAQTVIESFFQAK